jgi:hypothetical protein
MNNQPITDNMKQFTVLSLGAGIQSTTLALMAMHGLIEKPQYAIFADTGWESSLTIEHLNELEKLLDFPVIRANNGNLLSDLIRGLSSPSDYFTPPPFFNSNGSIGMRHCTSDYKIIPIKRMVRKLLSAGKRTRLYGKYVTMQIGISLDECHRAKPSNVDFIRHEFPLLNLRLSRIDCEKWLRQHGYKIPPKSSCVGCPFHSNTEWQRIKSDCPTEFDIAVGVDELLKIQAYPEFMHKSLKPINKIAFVDNRQIDLFGNECTGLCGV